MPEHEFSFTGRIRSFRYALQGLGVMLRTQHNAWIHLAATIIVCAFGVYAGLDRIEWCWIVVAVVSVWAAEALNTAFELLADAASPEYHPLVGKAKDVAAGAVLVTAIGAAVIGVLTLGPHVYSMLIR